MTNINESKEKRKLKTPINFKFQLNDEQKEAKQKILDNDITIITGKAGSGKSTIVIQAALDYLFHRQCERIIVARPTVTAGEDIGFLPGGIKEKLDPFIAPIYDNAYRLYDKSKVDKYFEEGKIEIVPFAYMRGRNFSDAFVIVDEAQNITNEQMKLVISRMCIGSKMVIVGDIAQIDLKSNKQSGMFFLSNSISDKVKGITSVVLKTNHRHPIVESVLEIYENLKI